MSSKQFYIILQFGMLIPAGTPLPEKVKISSEVKSGRKYESFSNCDFHGSNFSRSSAFSTSLANLAEDSLLTIATKPSNSARPPAGSRYVSMKPM